jgi:RimJ/RimL family protein N-acetyltransferase
VREAITERIRRHGLLGSARAVRHRLTPRRPFHRDYVWYALDLQRPREARPLGPGLELRAGGPEDIRLLAQLPPDPSVGHMDEQVARERLAGTGRLWLVTEGDQLAFACWTFRDRTPVWAAHGGSLALPEGVACLEDSHSSPHFRGRGIAPAAWGLIADALAAERLRSLVTKVAVDNAPSCRAVEKAGFEAFGGMDVSVRDWRTRISVRLDGPESSWGWLRSVERGNRADGAS